MNEPVPGKTERIILVVNFSFNRSIGISPYNEFYKESSFEIDFQGVEESTPK